MTRKHRAAIYELIAISFAGLGLAFAVPTLVSAHDTVALVAVLFLLVAWGGWVSYFGYRFHQQENK